MLCNFVQILLGNVFVSKPVHQFTSHSGIAAHILWWHHSETENKFSDEIFLNPVVHLCAQRGRKYKLDCANWLPWCHTDFCLLKNLSLLSEKHTSWQYLGKASSSWLNKPKFYSDNYYCFPIYTILHKKCGFINWCGTGMKWLHSKQISPAILNLHKLPLPTIIILKIFGTLSLELVSGKYVETRRNLPYEIMRVKRPLFVWSHSVSTPYHKIQWTKKHPNEGLHK